MRIRLPLCRLSSLVCCILLQCIWSFSCRFGKSNSEQDMYTVEDLCTYLFSICIDSLVVTDYTVKSGDNLSTIFSKLGISATQSERIYKASTDFLDPKKLQPGLPFYTLSTQDSIKSIRYIIFAKSPIEHTVIDLTSHEINVYPYQKEITRKQKYISGSVKSSLWNEISRQGANPVLSNLIADIFAWQVDFFAIQPKDSFQILYTESFRDDTISLNRFTVEGAIFMHDRKSFIAIPFMQDSIMEYFDVE